MKNKKVLGIFIFLLLLTLVGSFLVPSVETNHDISIAMRDSVLHEVNKVSLFGIMDVNPAVISAFINSGLILLGALIVRIFFIPKFKFVPGKFQLIIESWVDFFVNMAKSNSPHKNWVLGAYIFSAGSYILMSTLFELLGLQWLSSAGESITMPAPLSDINAAIAMGFLSYFFIMSGGVATNGIKGLGKVLKDFSLPLSMSFRLFGALLSGLLVTDLVYHYIQLSFVLPVIIAVLFTLIHAFIQAYVLTLLTSIYYGEVTEKDKKISMSKEEIII